MAYKGIFKSFRVRVAIVVVFAMAIAAMLSNFIIFRYTSRYEFNQLRKKLMTVAELSSFMVDGDLLKTIPLNEEGKKALYYKELSRRLEKITDTYPIIHYIYILAKTDKKDILKFVMDVQSTHRNPQSRPAASPGDEFNSEGFEQMKKAFYRAQVERKPIKDAWGLSLSSYAPVRDKKGNIVAILGIDMAASDVARLEKEVRRRSLLVFVFTLIISMALGMMISGRVASPVRRLIEAANRIAKGDLDDRVEVKGDDDISKLADVFNKMSSELKLYIEELKNVTAEKERFIKELEIATKIQQSFLPEKAPLMRKYDIAMWSLPARKVGGDFYDFILKGDDRVGVVIGDVSGKGVPAAMFMAFSKTIIRATSTHNPNFDEAIKAANEMIFEDEKTNMFVTLFYGILDEHNPVISYVNAGHDPAIVMRKDNAQRVFLDAESVPLGLIQDTGLKVETVNVAKGDVIILYTDGLKDALNPYKENFGIERLLDVVASNMHLTAEGILGAIKNQLDEFTAGESQFDDITVLVIKVK